MRRFCVGMLVASLLCSYTAAAQTPPVEIPVLPAIPEGQDQHTPINKGQQAAYSGFLFDTLTATRWGNWLVLWKERYRIDMQQERQLRAVDSTLAAERLKIEQQRSAAVISSYKEQLELVAKKNDQPQMWYRSFEFGVGVGVTTAVVLVLLTGYALQHTN